jgi:FkbM family methyltransferase
MNIDLDYINKIKQLLIPYEFPNLKRYGGNYDGGYILAENLLNESNIIYSYGVGPDESWITFDKEMLSLNKKIFLYDNLKDSSWISYNSIYFKSEYVNSKNIYNHIIENSHTGNHNMVLKMDIEGNEYETLLYCNDDIFKHFNQITIEVHDIVNSHLEPYYLINADDNILRWENKIKLFNKLNEKYTLVHIHGNNNSSRIIEGIADVLELSYIRNDCMPYKNILEESCPRAHLDYPNNTKLPDIFMNWWLK